MAATHIFCPSCGSKNDFANGRKPNFCSGCGYNFNSLAAFGAEPTVTRPPRPVKQNDSVLDLSSDNESEEQGTEEAGISRADLSIDVNPVQKVKVGSFFQNPIPPEEARHAMNAKARTSAKKAFEAYKEEAGGNGLKRQEIGGPA